VGEEAVAAYERALDSLSDSEREAVIARVEMDMSYAEIAVALGKPSPDAARVAISRALLRLAEEMGHGRA
jgi:RNA polymerase sigma-70 factor (ECF subfamily)